MKNKENKDLERELQRVNIEVKVLIYYFRHFNQCFNKVKKKI